MSGIIEVRNSNLKGFILTAYFPERYFDGDKLDFTKAGGDSFLLISSCSHLTGNEIAKTREKNPFIWLYTNSIFSDASSIDSNVEIRVTRELGVFGWMAFWAVTAHRSIKGLVEKAARKEI